MAKDRFSRFKKSNYNKQFRYGNSSMNYVGVGKRDKLNQEQRNWIINLIKKIKFDGDKKFLRSVLVTNKVPTPKQKEIIKSIYERRNY